jgi:hypothetical protein
LQQSWLQQSWLQQSWLQQSWLQQSWLQQSWLQHSFTAKFTLGIRQGVQFVFLVAPPQYNQGHIKPCNPFGTRRKKLFVASKKAAAVNISGGF